ncbi:MAG: pyridoxal 5'-phosphate synthase glutaminase subunit PdxT [Chloroflexi bacterium]|nr:pyridoxal 5'-phosphate synthase glutaminase subunit PdxT [Chloroflexota bacterium]MCH8222092.1 pyridoxal 5'-phosphate synthase glutaminase subunit PdxT [Chloroflexota bacterium]
MTRVGVLAIQGDFHEHILVLESLGVETSEVRLPKQLEGLDGLIIPGGESTTIVMLADLYGLRDAIRSAVDGGMALWGTCAGMIVIARELAEDRPEPFNLVDMKVSRNWFGRQVDSFEQDLQIEGIEGGPYRCVFIRAPAVTELGDGVETIASVNGGTPVAVRSGKILATAFHPELTDDTRVHQLFLTLAEGGPKS